MAWLGQWHGVPGTCRDGSERGPVTRVVVPLELGVGCASRERGWRARLGSTLDVAVVVAPLAPVGRWVRFDDGRRA